MPAPALTPLTAEQRALVARWHRMALKYANRDFRRFREALRGVSFEEVLAAYHQVLIGVVRNFDPATLSQRTGRHVPFSSYLVSSFEARSRNVVARLLRYQRDHDSLRFSELQQPRRSGGESEFDPADGRDGTAAAFEGGDQTRRLLARLSTVEAAVVWRRFGLDGGPPMTVGQVAAELNLKPADVERHEVAAMERMRVAA